MTAPASTNHRVFLQAAQAWQRLARVVDPRPRPFNGLHVFSCQARNSRKMRQKVQCHPLHGQQGPQWPAYSRNGHSRFQFRSVGQNFHQLDRQVVGSRHRRKYRGSRQNPLLP